jgi:hypothetical protein
MSRHERLAIIKTSFSTKIKPCDTYVKQNLITEEKMIEFIELKIYDLESYVLNLRNEEEK